MIELTGKLEGSLYLVHVLPEFTADRTQLGASALDAGLSRGQDCYFRRGWRDMKAADGGQFETHQRPALRLPAISREAVTQAQLMAWSGLEPGVMRRDLKEWRPFLDAVEEAGTEPLWRLYHRSFADFLNRMRTCAGATTGSRR